MPRKFLSVLCFMAIALSGCMNKAEKQARDAFLFGYPLVMTDETRLTSAYPANTIQHLRTFPDHTFRNVVRPNVDTLYSIIWLDLKDDALVLGLPDSQGRYVLMPMLDAWSNVFASIGSRTTGSDARKYLIVGPDWEGQIPNGMALHRSPTAMAWMVGRIYAKGPEDFEGAHAYQDGMTLQTLSNFQNGIPMLPQPARPMNPVDVKQKIEGMDASVFFDRLENLMTDNPPTKEDEAFIEKTWRPLMAHEPDNETLNRGKDSAYKRFHFINKMIGRRKGWGGMDPAVPMGEYGTNYPLRAFIAHIGFGANEPVDAVYPNTVKDDAGKALHSSNNYVVHFAKDELPPVKAFWSLTMYDDEGFLIDNAIGRYALGAQNSLIYNQDGSLDIYVQAVAPDVDQLSNWLPAPKDAPFALTLRLYWPKDEVLSGDWNAPKVLRQ